ncbi:MAG: alpha/beta hydrolase [Actinomyces sp.]|uniref:alpha/beta fold hydrolase n=1 Tax=Actinomyces sp. TaxID=29317 RepID=UPI0026DD21D5|nr:alpha/beta hydrolase [Actinomyces sp.]MDO4243836.1 alpha/beta hydrolase [Actinomyces sp.]
MPVTVNRPGPWTHRDLSAGGTRFHVALAGPEAPVVDSSDAANDPPAPLILLLHGFPECWWTWREIIPGLADAGHRVAAMDLRGFGGSDRPPSGYDLVTLAQDVMAVVRALGHERVVVVGSGLGGQVAWVLAGLSPSTTAAIVPVGAPHPVAVRSLRGRSFSGSALQYLSFKLPVLPERSLSTTAGVEGLLRSWAGPRTKSEVAESAGYYAALMARPGAARSALETVRRTRLSRSEAVALGAPVGVPVLSVQGELDPVQPAQAYARDTHHVAGRLHQATIRGVGHFPQVEAPAELLTVLLPFLAEAA